MPKRPPRDLIPRRADSPTRLSAQPRHSDRRRIRCSSASSPSMVSGTHSTWRCSAMVATSRNGSVRGRRSIAAVSSPFHRSVRGRAPLAPCHHRTERDRFIRKRSRMDRADCRALPSQPSPRAVAAISIDAAHCWLRCSGFSARPSVSRAGWPTGASAGQCGKVDHHCRVQVRHRRPRHSRFPRATRTAPRSRPALACAASRTLVTFVDSHAVGGCDRGEMRGRRRLRCRDLRSRRRLCAEPARSS